MLADSCPPRPLILYNAIYRKCTIKIESNVYVKLKILHCIHRVLSFLVAEPFCPDFTRWLIFNELYNKLIKRSSYQQSIKKSHLTILQNVINFSQVLYVEKYFKVDWSFITLKARHSTTTLFKFAWLPRWFLYWFIFEISYFSYPSNITNILHYCIVLLLPGCKKNCPKLSFWGQFHGFKKKITMGGVGQSGKSQYNILKYYKAGGSEAFRHRDSMSVFREIE